ncbi:MAG: bifunctional 5,10-methylene-tetrahydrofolate dehydrogenase/5,10-methylene-tetrahydrofolate cyclohydrolase [Acidiferrobacteraceae bacterium]|jgi:methylenetetrahydrofolate dehydrogenase (NADP+)/methenyltetrahydrofolate cyclohydrolase|nr:bifunctional 5,10-methylene-tetrahydrofolate dehydrogenase/5,10-methylene-tetrahydrofolate cyclohydrolase [Acidiferrobacteraceae bacterium]MDP6399295.1 bifunctional 5,10-methylenetetrahydrofolate dehydrogenase/5,10-methenyltetrahydrofolate cyclohydrolase [Arenicellales bacterium]MDP6552930.1 bifunctional 5,10-methylenetetrahydrofolate dehydrogenase/5,10-methenyltetrahydrofolate cyclohydrolase [Arenicellales bacterium]MDP6919159.1 bifunctional 5,10-methylenetetrahydrofolate dehydrogenase/5,10-|tara:strand:- start:10213 stop:11112 length:900 start_codon:yes stop_codon:yes gene_type:complete
MAADYRDIDGRAVASKMLAKTATDVNELKSAGWQPRLVSIRVGDDPAVNLYIRNQERAATQTGIDFECRNFAAEISEGEVQAAITHLNVDPGVTGIILQRPVPAHLPIQQLQSTIHPLKDVEGMHPASIGNIVYRNLDLGPCTAMAAIELLKQTGVSLPGLEVTVIGHSEIVGKPIAFLLMAEGATVTVCHHMTREVAVHTRRADAVFIAVGKPGLLKGEMLKPGAVVVDIGINQIESEDGNSRVVGDCDYDACREVAGWITPVPGGVGPVTVAVLMRNTVVAARRLQTSYADQLSSHL